MRLKNRPCHALQGLHLRSVGLRMNTVYCPCGHNIWGDICLECLRVRLEELEHKTQQFQQDLGDTESVLQRNRIVQEKTARNRRVQGMSVDILKYVKIDI